MALMTRPFLTVEELAGKGTRDIAGETLGYIEQGQRIGMNQRKIRDVDESRAAQQKRSQDFEVMSGAPEAGQPTVAAPQATAEQAPTAPITPAAPVASAAPMGAPTVAQPSQIPPMQAAVAAPIGTVGGNAQPAAAAVATEQAQPAPVTAPPTAAQPAPAQPMTAATVKGSPQIDGKPNPLSDDALNVQKQRIQALVESGRVSASSAKEYIAGLEAVRDKQVDRALTLREKIATIADKETTTRKKEIEVAAEIRKHEDNQANDVYVLAKGGDLAGARALATQYGIPPEAVNPESPEFKTLEQRANRSPDAAQIREEARKTAEEGRKVAKEEREGSDFKWKVDGDTGLSVGVDPKSGNPVFKDSSGKVYSSQQAAQMGTTSKTSVARAGATTIVNGGPDRAGDPIPQGAIRIAVSPAQQIDATEKVQIANDTVKSLNQMQTLYAEIVKESGFDPKDSRFKANFNAWYKSNIDNNPKVREYNAIKQRVSNQSLRLNKGAQTESDANRDLAAMGDLGMPPDAHRGVTRRLMDNALDIRDGNEQIRRGYVLPLSEDKKGAPGKSFEEPKAQNPVQSKWGQYGVKK